MNSELAKTEITRLLPDADVRIDQCPTVRIYWQDRIAAMSEAEDGIKVSVMLIPEADGAGLVPDAYIKDVAGDEAEAARKLVKWLRRVLAANW